VARTDYAISCGTAQSDEIGAGPAANADQLSTFGSVTTAATTAQFNYFTPGSGNASTWAGQMALRATGNFQKYTGISFELSTIRKDDVTAGLSCTLLAGEKYIDPVLYNTGTDGYDNENAYVGFDNDIGRTTYQVPMQDRAGNDDGGFAFGSAHATAANFVLCDGAVIPINYSVNAAVFLGLGNRSNTIPTDMSKLGVGGG